MTDPIKRLRAANPVPDCPSRPIEELWRRMDINDEQEPRLRRAGSPHSRRGTARPVVVGWSGSCHRRCPDSGRGSLRLVATACPSLPTASRACGSHARELAAALVIYGVGPGNAGLNIRKGRPFATAWGTGYVLTNNDRSVVCAVAPGLGQQNWGASCARTEIAKREGTATFEYAYDKTNNTARFLTLLPAGATATAQLPGGHFRPLPVHDGVLAFVVRHQMVITTHIGDHVNVVHLSPSHATPATAPANPAAGSHAATTSAGSGVPGGQ